MKKHKTPKNKPANRSKRRQGRRPPKSYGRPKTDVEKAIHDAVKLGVKIVRTSYKAANAVALPAAFSIVYSEKLHRIAGAIFQGLQLFAEKRDALGVGVDTANILERAASVPFRMLRIHTLAVEMFERLEEKTVVLEQPHFDILANAVVESETNEEFESTVKWALTNGALNALWQPGSYPESPRPRL